MTRTRIAVLVSTIAILTGACGGGISVTSSSPVSLEDPTTADGSGVPGVTGSDTGTELTSIRLAIEETTTALSGRVEGSMEISGLPDLPSGVMVIPFGGAFTGTGDFSFHMDLAALAEAAGDEIPAGAASLLETMELRQVGDTAYISFPVLTMLFGLDTEWLAVPAGDSAGLTQDLGFATPTSPTEMLDMLADLDALVDDLGVETVNGLETTHYRVVFDTETLYELADPQDRARLDAQSIPFDSLPIDFWITESGVITRFVMDIEVDGSPGATGRMVMTYDLIDLGDEVVIDAPPEHEVTDAAEVASLAGMLGGG